MTEKTMSVEKCERRGHYGIHVMAGSPTDHFYNDCSRCGKKAEQFEIDEIEAFLLEYVPESERLEFRRQHFGLNDSPTQVLSKLRPMRWDLVSITYDQRDAGTWLGKLRRICGALIPDWIRSF